MDKGAGFGTFDGDPRESNRPFVKDEPGWDKQLTVNQTPSPF